MRGSERRTLVFGFAVACLTFLLLPAVAQAFVYWGNFGTNAIGRANLNGSGASLSFLSEAGVSGVAVDGKFIYWASNTTHTIGRANLDGTDPNSNFITGTVGISGVSVAGNFIYWANYGGTSIGRANLDGTGVNNNFITGLSGPTDVRVFGNYIYWANYVGSSTIGRANLDGTGVNNSFITGASEPIFLASDGTHLYWTNWTSDTIGRANLDGTGANESFIATGSEPAGIAVDGSKIYWTNYGGGTLGAANLDGTGVNNSFITGATEPWGLAIDLPPANVTAPTISGSPVQGNTLTVTNGTWSMNPTTFSDEWLRCSASGSNCAPIATGQAYTLTPADVGWTIEVQEVASNPLGGSGAPATSAPTAVVSAPPSPPSLPPAPTPPPQPRGAPSLSLNGASGSGAVANLSITCQGATGQTCAGSATGTVQEHKRAAVVIAVTASKKHGKPKVKVVTVTVAQNSFSVPAGATQTVSVGLNGAGKRLLNSLRKLPVKLAITGIAATPTVTLKLPVTPIHLGTPPDSWFHINLPCSNCYTTPQSVPITGVPKGAHVTVICQGAGCPFGLRSVTPAHGAINLAAVLGGAHLEPGDKVKVVVSAPGRASVTITYKIQRGAVPVRSIS